MGEALLAGDYSRRLQEVRDGKGNAEKLLVSKLDSGDAKLSPAEAATNIMKDLLASTQKNTQEVFKALNSQAETQERSPEGLQMGALGEASTAGLVKKLESLSLAKPNHLEAMKTAHALLAKDSTLQPNLTSYIQGKLWEDIRVTRPDADPKALAEAYQENLEKLAETAKASGLDLKLNELTDSSKKSIANTFTELSNVAKKLDANATVERLSAQIKILQTASDLIATDITNLTQKLTQENDPGKKTSLEAELQKLRDTQLSLIGGKDPTSGGVVDRKYSQIGVLEEHIQKLQTARANGANPVVNKGLEKAVAEANAAVTSIELVTPLINHGPKPILNAFKPIDTTALDKVCTAYAGSKSTGDNVLQPFKKSVDALNAATKELTECAQRLVTPETMEACKKKYKEVVKKVDKCCENIAQQLNNDAARELLETAYASKGDKKDLKTITDNLSKLNRAALRLALTAGLKPEARDIESLGDDSRFIKAVKAVAPKWAKQHETDSRKKNAEALQQYYTFSYKERDPNTGKWETKKIMDHSTPPQEVRLSYEEAKALVAKVNADPKNKGKKPIEVRDHGDTYDIVCHDSKRRKEFIPEMIAFQDEKLGNKVVKENAVSNAATAALGTAGRSAATAATAATTAAANFPAKADGNPKDASGTPTPPPTTPDRSLGNN